MRRRCMTSAGMPLAVRNRIRRSSADPARSRQVARLIVRPLRVFVRRCPFVFTARSAVPLSLQQSFRLTSCSRPRSLVDVIGPTVRLDISTLAGGRRFNVSSTPSSGLLLCCALSAVFLTCRCVCALRPDVTLCLVLAFSIPIPPAMVQLSTAIALALPAIAGVVSASASASTRDLTAARLHKRVQAMRRSRHGRRDGPSPSPNQSTPLVPSPFVRRARAASDGQR